MTGAASQIFAHVSGEISPPAHESRSFDGSASVQPVLPGRIGEQSSASTIIGVLFGIAALAGIIANPIVGHLMTSTIPRLLVGAGIVAVAAALLVIGWSVELWQIGTGMGLLGLSSAMLLAPATTLISEQGFRSEPPTLGVRSRCTTSLMLLA